MTANIRKTRRTPNGKSVVLAVIIAGAMGLGCQWKSKTEGRAGSVGMGVGRVHNLFVRAKCGLGGKSNVFMFAASRFTTVGINGRING